MQPNVIENYDGQDIPLGESGISITQAENPELADLVGKTLGTDLEKGKLTLPLLNLIREATETQKAKLNKLLLQNEPLETSVLAGIADYEGALESALDEAKSLLQGAREDLVGLEDSDYRRALIQVTNYVDCLLDDCQK